MSKNPAAFILTIGLLLFLTLSACTPIPPKPKPTATVTATATKAPVMVVQVTDTPILLPTAQPTISAKLCDNDYIPSDEDTTWVYSGASSAKGAYTRTDKVSEARGNGFTVTTKLKDITYSEEFDCTQAGLINLEPAKGDLAAIFKGQSGTITVTRRANSGITILRHPKPGNTWQQVFDWTASGTNISAQGKFIYQYSVMGYEVVTVPFGSFTALRIDIEIQLEMGSSKSITGTYSDTIWLVTNIGLVKSEGISKIKGAEFTDSIELTSFEKP